MPDSLLKPAQKGLPVETNPGSGQAFGMPPYYDVLRFVKRGQNNLRRYLYAGAIALLISGAFLGVVVAGGISGMDLSVSSVLVALFVGATAFFIFFRVVPELWSFVDSELKAWREVERCLRYLYRFENMETIASVERMAEIDKSRNRAVSAVMPSMWGGIIALVLVGAVLPIEYVLVIGIFAFITLPIFVVTNGEQEHADIVIVQAISVYRSQQAGKVGPGLHAQS